VLDVLRRFRLLKSEILAGGGNRSLISQRIDTTFYAKGWEEKGFATSIIVDESKSDSPTHAVDCFKGSVAVEMEWNNKDPFFDRDTTHHEKLWPKVKGGGGGGCPVLTFAIKPINFEDDGPAAHEALKARIAKESEAKKAAKKSAKRRGLPMPDNDEG
jgi:hypothetical protein